MEKSFFLKAFMHEHIHTDLLAVQSTIDTLSNNKILPPLSAFVDGRGLSCPLPLLKTKLALRAMTVGECLYMVASDKNSVNDLSHFCQKNPLSLEYWQSPSPEPLSENQQSATLYHFLISKLT